MYPYGNSGRQRVNWPDENEAKDSGQRHGNLEKTPLSEEVRPTGQNGASERPEELVRYSGDRSLLGREQFSGHNEPGNVDTLKRRTSAVMLLIIVTKLYTAAQRNSNYLLTQ